ncbi:MAG: hypothetical protein ACP6IS_07285 [Candidatus Asgardarchaeia archaeon]
MAELMRGIKAGAIAGFIEGIIVAIIYAAFFNIIFGPMLQNPPANMPISAYEQLIYYSVVTAAPFGGLISGIIIGAIFSFVYSYLPTENSIIKSMVLGVIFWLISLISNMSLGVIIVAQVAVNFVTSVLVFGYLLGFFWDKFTPKEA